MARIENPNCELLKGVIKVDQLGHLFIEHKGVGNYNRLTPVFDLSHSEVNKIYQELGDSLLVGEEVWFVQSGNKALVTKFENVGIITSEVDGDIVIGTNTDSSITPLERCKEIFPIGTKVKSFYKVEGVVVGELAPSRDGRFEGNVIVSSDKGFFTLYIDRNKTYAEVIDQAITNPGFTDNVAFGKNISTNQKLWSSEKTNPNQVIKALTIEHGRQIIDYWKNVRGVSTFGYEGIMNEKDGNVNIYYGVINGKFSNHEIEKVLEYRAEIIELPKNGTIVDTIILEEKYAEQLAEVERLFPEGTHSSFREWSTGMLFTGIRTGRLIVNLYEGHCRILSTSGVGILWSTKYGYSIPIQEVVQDPSKKAVQEATQFIDNREKFEEACRPLMKYLCENHNPHMKVIVDGNSAELLEGERFFRTDEYTRLVMKGEQTTLDKVTFTKELVTRIFDIVSSNSYISDNKVHFEKTGIEDEIEDVVGFRITLD